MSHSLHNPPSRSVVFPIDPEDIPRIARECYAASLEFGNLLRKIGAGLCPVSNLSVSECSECTRCNPNHYPQGVQARLLSIKDRYPNLVDFLTRISGPSDEEAHQ